MIGSPSAQPRRHPDTESTLLEQPDEEVGREAKPPQPYAVHLPVRRIGPQKCESNVPSQRHGGGATAEPKRYDNGRNGEEELLEPPSAASS